MIRVTILCQWERDSHSLPTLSTCTSQRGDRSAAPVPAQALPSYSWDINAVQLRGRSTTMIVNQHLSSREIQYAFPKGLPDAAVRDSIATAIQHDYQFGKSHERALPESMRPVLASVHSTTAPRVSTYYSKVESSLAAQGPAANQTQGARVRANVNILE